VIDDGVATVCTRKRVFTGVGDVAVYVWIKFPAEVCGTFEYFV